MEIRLLLLTVFVWINLCSGYSQQISFKSISTKDGLPSTEVYNLYEDRQGYIWAFTKYGIVKHNGTRFMPVCTNMPFSESAIYSVSESPSGKIYITSSTGNFYEIVHDSAFLVKGMEDFSELLKRNSFFINMIYAFDDRIYVQPYQSNSYEFDLRSNKMKKMQTGPAYSNDSGFAYKQISPHTLFPSGGTDEKKYLYIERSGKTASHLLPYNSNFRTHATGICNSKGSYLLTVNSLVFIDKLNRIKIAKFGQHNLDFKIDKRGHIWIATHTSGLVELDTNLNIINQYLEGHSISGILFDKQDGLWISTISNGIYYCRNIHEQHDVALPGMATMIRVIGKKLFTGSSNGWLREHNPDGIVRSLHTPPAKIMDMQDIIPFRNGYAIASKSGIYLTDTNLRIYSDYKSTAPFMSSLSYAMCSYNDSLLLSLSTRAIFVFNSTHIKRTDQFIAKSQCLIQRSEKLWLYGTYRGLYHYDLRHITSPLYLQTLCEKNIRCMVKDSLQNVWIGTEGNGLYRLHPDNTLQKINSLPASVVNHLSLTEDGAILCATNTGLFISMQGDLFKKIYEGEVMLAANYAGKIFLSNDNGLITIDAPLHEDHNRYPFYLRSTLVNGSEGQVSNQVLAHHQNHLQFNFDFLNYAYPDKKYFFNLSGPVHSSGYAKGTQLTFQQLPPGSYSLSVTLILFDNIPDSTRTFYFTIEPAVWQTAWFRSIAIAAGIALLLVLFMLMQKYTRKKEYRKNEIKRLLAEHKLTALKAQINPHFISNSLAAIQQLMLSDHSDKAGRYIAKFSLMIRSVLKHSDESIVTLSEELRIIDLNIDLEQLRFGQAFSFSHTTDPSVDPDEVWVPPLITQPFIENAIWHGLLPLKNSRPGLLSVKISKCEDQLVISIIDNGVGRQESSRSKTFGGSHQSRGNELSLKRIENLNKLYEARQAASIHITDLFDDNQAPAGTQVDIVLPFISTKYHAFKKDKVYHY